jgi:hypothetical protein
MGNYYARFGGGHLEKGSHVPRQVSTLQLSPLKRGVKEIPFLRDCLHPRYRSHCAGYATLGITPAFPGYCSE